MKKLSVVVLATVALSAAAQHKIDFPGRMVIEQARLEQQSNANTGSGTLNTLSSGYSLKSYGVMVEFNGTDIDFGNEQVEIISQIGDIAVVSLTPEQMERVAALPQVRRITLGHDVRPMMDAGRAATHVDEVHSGTVIGKAYTGKGVVAGLYDIGLDVNHINFKDSDGNIRTKRLWVYNGTNPVTYDNATAISNYTTENAKETHGTHVLGIMAGSYNGPATYMYKNSSGRTLKMVQTNASSAVPYYGVAKGADLAVTCGSLNQAYIVSGVQKIVDYATSNNQPCVVNLSIGNNIGPHDGSDASSRALDQLGERAIICISAGNEGSDNISITTTGTPIKTFYGTNSGSANRANGYIDLWGLDNRVYTVRVFGYNRGTGRETFSYTLDRNLAGGSVKQGDMNGFSSNFTGSITLSSNIDPANNRYNVSINVNTTGKTAQDIFGIAIEPLADQTVDGFSNAPYFMSLSQPGFTDGSPENSINGLACGDNVIVVGSFCTATGFPRLDGYVYSRQGVSPLGGISNFSSYGRKAKGRNLPDVCAPGEFIISSINEYYAQANQPGEGQVSAFYEPEGLGLFARNSRWDALMGTSMASPFAAGVIATWLEADPKLKAADVRDIMQKTSERDLLINSEIEKWGSGKINALAGLQEVLARNAGVNDVAIDNDNVMITTADSRNFDIFAAGANKVEAQLYSLAGMSVARAEAEGSNLTLSAENALPGIYVLTVNVDGRTETHKVVVK